MPNPLAREIVDAVQLLGLKVVFEPGKIHPRDWSNPGRVRVLLREAGKAQSPQVKNSMYNSFLFRFAWSGQLLGKEGVGVGVG